MLLVDCDKLSIAAIAAVEMPAQVYLNERGHVVFEAKHSHRCTKG